MTLVKLIEIITGSLAENHRSLPCFEWLFAPNALSNRLFECCDSLWDSIENLVVLVAVAGVSANLPRAPVLMSAVNLSPPSPPPLPPKPPACRLRDRCSCFVIESGSITAGAIFVHADIKQKYNFKKFFWYKSPAVVKVSCQMFSFSRFLSFSIRVVILFSVFCLLKQKFSRVSLLDDKVSGY